MYSIIITNNNLLFKYAYGDALLIHPNMPGSKTNLDVLNTQNFEEKI